MFFFHVELNNNCEKRAGVTGKPAEADKCSLLLEYEKKKKEVIMEDIISYIGYLSSVIKEWGSGEVGFSEVSQRADSHVRIVHRLNTMSNTL